MHTIRDLAIGLCAVACGATATAQLSGTYVINPTLAASPVTFPSFADAVAALTAQGVAGPCEFLVFDDAGPYTEASAFPSNNAYGNNDAVVVLTSWAGASSSNRVTFRPAQGERPVLDASGRSMGIFWGGADYVTVQGFEIRNAVFDGISLYAEAQHGIANDPIIDDCRIHDCNGTAITIYGNSAQPANTLVQNCTMWRCQLTGGGTFSTTGRFGYISTRRTNGTRVVNNTFYADTLTNSASYCIIGCRCSSVVEVPFAEISNNIFVKLTASSTPLFRFDTPTGSTSPLPTICESNCFFDASGGDFAMFGAQAGTTAATLLDWQQQGVDTTSITGDPNFTNTATRDFHLAAGSPCIAASTLSAGVLLDADGQTRSSPTSIGSDEFSAATYALVGAGCAGTGNLTAELDLWSWPYLGNPALPIGIESTPPNSVVALFGSLGISTVPLPIGFGCEAYLDPASFVSLAALVTEVGGTGSVVLPVPSSATFAGINIGYQALVLDAGAPLGFTVSNGIDATFDF